MKNITLRSIALAFALSLAAATGATAGRYPAPRLLGIFSPKAGTVEIMMEVSPSSEGYIGAFLVYRREGNHTTAEKFEMLKRAGYPHYFMDTTGSPEFSSEEGVLKLIITGIKSGTCSYYITQTSAWRAETESEPSNILSINVAGHSAEDGDIDGGLIPWSVAGVAIPIDDARFAPYPNPAASAVHIPLPPNGPAVVRVLDAAGREVMRHVAGSGAAEERLDVSALAAGIYYTETLAGNRIARSRFTVIR